MHIVSACGWFLNGISFAVGRLFLSAAWPSTPFSSFLFCFFSGLLPPQSPVINNALNILIVAQGSNCIDRCVWRARFSSQYPGYGIPHPGAQVGGGLGEEPCLISFWFGFLFFFCFNRLGLREFVSSTHNTRAAHGAVVFFFFSFFTILARFRFPAEAGE